MAALYTSLTTSDTFKEKYIKKLPISHRWQQGPLQVYTLMSDYLKLPTPLLLTDYNCVFYLEEGVFMLQVGHEKIKAVAPSLVFISSGTIISFEKVEKKLKGYFLLMEDNVLSSIFNNETALNLLTVNPIIALKNDENIWFNTVCNLLYQETDKSFLNNAVSHGFLQAFLFKILHLSGSKKSLTRTQEVAINFQHLVYKNFIKEKNTPFYAQSLSVSENYLNRCVKSVFGKTAKELIIQIAVLNSRMLMWNTTKPIWEICYELNFTDPSYFSRIFKKVTGKTPSQYRSFILHDLS